MRKLFFSGEGFCWSKGGAVVLLSWMVLVGMNEVREVKKRPLYFPPPKGLKHFHFGHADFMADFLWLRHLQKADFCFFNSSSPVKKRGCPKNWSYPTVDLITDLAPRFKTPYVFSVIMNSVFAGERAGGEVLLRKALSRFPDDKDINLYAAYFYSLEARPGASQKVAHFAYRAARAGGPYWLYGLAARQHIESGHPVRARKLIQHIFEGGFLTQKQKNKIKKHLNQLPPFSNSPL